MDDRNAVGFSVIRGLIRALICAFIDAIGARGLAVVLVVQAAQVHPGPGAGEVGGGEHAAQGSISLERARQQGQMGSIFFLQGDLTADDRPDASLPRLLVEADHAIEAMVGDRHGRHAQGLGLLQEGLVSGSSVQQAEFGVNVKVNEVYAAHVRAYLGSPMSSAARLAGCIPLRGPIGTPPARVQVLAVPGGFPGPHLLAAHEAEIPFFGGAVQV
jgi:hypothetical protein